MLDYLFILDTAFWAAVDPVLPEEVVAPACRLKSALGLNQLKRQHFRMPADFPVVTLNLRDNNLVNPYRTFGHNSPTFTTAEVDVHFAARVVLEILCVYQQQKLEKHTQVVTYIQAALVAKYPHMDVSQFKVTDWQLGTGLWRNEKFNENGLVLPTFRMPWVIQARIPHSVLESA